MHGVVTPLAEPTESARPVGRPCGEIRVVLVDDDATFRTALRELLRDDGHVVQAHAAVAELPPLTELPTPGVLITDCQLGGHENGLTLARRFNAAHPGARIIILTAYASSHLEQSVVNVPYVALLHKPVQYEILHHMIHDCT